MVRKGVPSCHYDCNLITLKTDEPLSGAQLKQPLLDTGAPGEYLKKIWALADMDKTGKLDKEQFFLVMWLAKEAANGKVPPATLPDNLIPPSKKKDTLF